MLRGLHKLCDKGNWDETAICLKTASGRANAQDKGGWGDWSPLHLACKRNPPQEIVRSLIEAAPQMIECTDMYQRYPIHHAAEWGANLGVIDVLCRANPQTVKAIDIDGRTPLHLSILGSNKESQQRRHSPSVGEIKRLLNGKGIAKIEDKAGNLPLHCACANIELMLEDSLVLLVDAYKEALTTRNQEGQTPLHLALQKCTEQNPSWNVFSMLLGDGKVTKMKNADGCLPLHLACKKYAPFEILDELLLQNKEGASIKDSNGLYPLEILEQMRSIMASPEEIEELNYKSDLLFAHFPDISPFREEYDRIQRLEGLITYEAQNSESLSDVGKMLWIWICTSPNRDHNALYSGCIERIVRECENDGNAMNILLNTKTEQGVHIRDCINPKRCAVLQPFLRFLDKYKVEKSVNIFHIGQTTSFVDAKDFSVVGDATDVLFNFMTYRDNFIRGKFIHDLVFKAIPLTSGYEPIVPILQSFDMDRIGTGDEQSCDREFCMQLKSQEDVPPSVRSFRYAFVIPKGKNTLDEVMRHQSFTHKEKFDVTLKIANALQCLHEKTVIHGNIRARNILFMTLEELRFIDLGSASVLSSEYMLGTHTAFTTNALAPELIAKLNSSEHQRYLRYWKSVKDYATIADLFQDDDVNMVSELVDSYLDVNSKVRYHNFWGYIEAKSKLWCEIRPLEVESESECDETWYYVPKCHITSPNKNIPYKEKCLPYDLVPATARHDIFGYGKFLLELFNTSQRSVNNFITFKSLFDWNNGDKFDYIKDPLVRNLIRSLLSRFKFRPKTMKEVLLHPLFETWKQRNLKIKSRQIILQNEHNELEHQIFKHRIYQQILARTIPVSSGISTSTQIKLLNSTCNQWKMSLPKNRKWDFIFPTSFMILPYDLVKDTTNEPTIKRSDLNLANLCALHMARVTYLTRLTGLIGQNFRHTPVRKILDKAVEFSNFVDQQRSTLTNVLELCDKIVQQVSRATETLTEMIQGLTENPKNTAHNIVSLKICDYVDLNKCREVLKKSLEVERVFAQLIDGMVVTSSLKAKEIVNEQIGKIVDNRFKQMIQNSHPIIESILKRLITSFAENPVVACKELLREKIDKYLSLFPQKGYFYPVDELSGKIMVPSDSSYPFAVGEDLIRAMLPSMSMTINATCSISAADGLTSLVGLKKGEISVKFENNILSGLQKRIELKSSLAELLFLQIALSGHHALTYSDLMRQSAENFKILKNLFGERDPQSKFAGLIRLRAADGVTVWATKENVKQAINDGNIEIQNYMKACSDEKSQVSPSPNTQPPAQSEAIINSSPKVRFAPKPCFSPTFQSPANDSLSFSLTLSPTSSSSSTIETLNQPLWQSETEYNSNGEQTLDYRPRHDLSPTSPKPSCFRLGKTGSMIPRDIHDSLSFDSLCSTITPDETFPKEQQERQPASVVNQSTKFINDYKSPNQNRRDRAFIKMSAKTEQKNNHSFSNYSSTCENVSYSASPLRREPLTPRRDNEDSTPSQRVRKSPINDALCLHSRKWDFQTPKVANHSKGRIGYADDSGKSENLPPSEYPDHSYTSRPITSNGLSIYGNRSRPGLRSKKNLQI